MRCVQRGVSPMFDLNTYYTYEDVNETVVELFRRFKGKSSPGSVLDVGCGRARLSQAIEALGYRVTGLEGNASACLTARERINEVVEIDLSNEEAVARALQDRQFDWLLFADVLEHTPDPLSVLRYYRRMLAQDGGLVVSLPNVAVWDNRIKFLAGRFNYADSGVMDRTHLRFFTFHTAHLLLREAGFTVTGTTFEPGIVRAFLPVIKRLMVSGGAAGKATDPGLILESPLYRTYQRYVLPVERAICSLAKGLFAFRIVIVAKPI